MPVLGGASYGYEQLNGWSVVLGDIMVAGGDIDAVGPPLGTNYCAIPPVKGCLTLPPDGLGVPNLRTQDVSYLGRDGVKQHNDWYEPRVVTLEVAVGKTNTCGCDPDTSVRKAVSQLVNEWRRTCDTQRELVLYPPNCSCDQENYAVDDIDRPLGVVGRPRQALLSYTRNGTAQLTLRFDAEDHLMYLLDCCGTPGSGERCEVITPSIDVFCRPYDRCYGDAVCGWSYDVEYNIAGGPAEFTGGGTECVGPTVRLHGPLATPRIESVMTGQTLQYAGQVSAGRTVEIDLASGTATEDGVDRTGKLEGDLVMLVQPGDNVWRLQAYSANDTGYAEICWRPAVIVA